MKTRFSLIVLVAVALLAAGCGSTPRERYVNTERVGIAAIDATKAAVNSGVVKDPEMLLALREAISEYNVQMDKAHDKIIAGESIDAQFYIDAADAAAQRVLAHLARVEKQKGK